jgi:hypothetical protein
MFSLINLAASSFVILTLLEGTVTSYSQLTEAEITFPLALLTLTVTVLSEKSIPLSTL